MTPVELIALIFGKMRAQPNYVEPMTLGEFEELKRRFPDKL
jgi:hypothetical protein